MRLTPAIPLLAATVLVSACTGATRTLGPGKTLGEFEAEYTALSVAVDDIFTAEGTTQFDDLPDTAGADTASYTGIIHGDMGGGSGPDLEYYADMTMNADFDNNTVSGSLENFVTDLSGFTAPTGTATITGSISEDLSGDAHIDLSASGELVQLSSATAADFNTTNTFGHFGGTDASVATGEHESNFLWTSGPNSGTTSWSDGEWYLQQD